MKKLTVTALCLLFTLVLLAPAYSAQLAGVTMADSLPVGNGEASLAGMGIRKKVIIKVYVAGLYMAEPSRDPVVIVSDDKARALSMHFVYSKVGAEKLQEAWREGFDRNTPGPSPDLKKKMDQFVALFSEDAVKGDEYLFAYNPGEGTKIVLKGSEKATIPGADFASALMAIWFGDYPADKGLKKSVLKGL